jgi:hypothetical protein
MYLPLADSAKPIKEIFPFFHKGMGANLEKKPIPCAAM